MPEVFVLLAYLLERGQFYVASYLLPNFLRTETSPRIAGILCNLLALAVFLVPSLLHRVVRPSLSVSVVLGGLALFAGWLAQHLGLSSLVLLTCTIVGACLARPIMAAVAAALPNRMRSVLALFLLANLGGSAGLLFVSMAKHPLRIGMAMGLGLAVLGLVLREDKQDVRPLATSKSLGLWWLVPGFTLLNAQTNSVIFVHLSRAPVAPIFEMSISPTFWGLWFALCASMAVVVLKGVLSTKPAECAVLGMVLSGAAFLLVALKWSTLSLGIFFFVSGFSEILLLPASFVDGLHTRAEIRGAWVDFSALQGVGYLLSLILTAVVFDRVSVPVYFAVLAALSVLSLAVWRWRFRALQP